MNNFRFIQNIKWINQYLLKHKKVSLSEFLEWPREVIQSFQEGATPTLDQLSKLHKELNVSFQELIENDLSLKPSLRWLKFNNNEANSNLQEINFFEIPLNIGKAGASSFSAVKSVKKTVRHLAKICVPIKLFEHQNPDKLKAFEIEGFSMHPMVKSGDVVIAEQLNRILNFREGEPHILLLKDGSLFFKRLFKVRNEPGKIQLLSDNPDFPQITLGVGLIAECWKMCHKIKSTEI